MTQQLTIEQLKFARSIGATHYDWNNRRFRKDGSFYSERKDCWLYGLNENQYNPRKQIKKIDFSPLDEPESEYVPKVGEECEVYTNDHGWINAKPVGEDGGEYVYRLEIPMGNRLEIRYMKCSRCKFRPLPDPEQQRRDELLEKWRSQSLENAHDTEASVLTVGEMIDFIVDLEGE
ncbi:MAG: hypothetical protein Tp138OMZ00d2C19078241_51 [Prokaryotic dsDNA virus sp.]|jgi:hypothetical protein|nr:MAG: hypothetical protein Tp138OMZ00d2C19078241_51 [Prokaryotic dsDNA virus sp.]|tara:strand:- start:5254 stop:5781 length:528 start_codon:yes stop_codon:yes gene_type:complete